MARRPARRFAPWRADFLAAALLALVGAAALWGGLTTMRPGAIALGVGVAVVCGLGARRAWQHGYRRWYGKELEAWAVGLARARLDRKRIRYEAGRWVPGHGDVDLLIHGLEGSCVVEIKSFERWNQRWFLRGEREERALLQAQGLQEAVGAQAALVWLPRGRRTLLQWFLGSGGHGVRVVFGDERKLIRVTRRAIGRLNRPLDGLN